MNIKNGSVVTANDNFCNEIFHVFIYTGLNIIFFEPGQNIR